MNPPLLEVRDFGKRYRRTVAVAEAAFEVGRGELFGLIGPDGAGKSSLMKAVAGVLAYEQGEIRAFGIPVDSEANAERVKDRMGFMPQGLGLNLYPELSVEENIDFFARLRQVPKGDLARRKQRLLEMTRLAPFRTRAMKNLSGGMKQKLGLICTLIHEPELVILDEPTTGVDPLSRRDFWAILAELLRERSISALVSTAYMDEASRFHRLALMHHGRVLDQGTPDRILARVPGTVVLLAPASVPEALARLKARFDQVEGYGRWVRLFAPGLERDAARRAALDCLDGMAVESLELAEPDLEDAFIQLLGRDEREAPLNLPKGGERRGRDRARVMIRAEELVRDFGDFRAVDHVSFEVHQGEIFGLLGANGAGRPAGMGVVTGMLGPAGGRGEVAGAAMGRSARAIRQRIGYMSQAFSLYQDLTVLENILLYGGIYGLHGRTLRERIQWVIELAGIHGHERDRAGRLPMGLRQRLALGCALVHRPAVLFLDEPTSGVDPLGRRRFWEILTHLSHQEGVTVLITTHYMTEAEHCDRLALMHAGRLVADAPPDELRRALIDEAGRLLEVRVDRPLEALELLRGAYHGVSLHGRNIHLFAPDPARARAGLARLLGERGYQLLGVRERIPTMEDVFVYRMRQLEAQAA